MSPFRPPPQVRCVPAPTATKQPTLGARSATAVATCSARLSCSFCNLVYHNKRGCLPKKWVISNELLNSSSYEWACPECVKKGAQMHQRKQVTPAGAVVAGKKRRRAR